MKNMNSPDWLSVLKVDLKRYDRSVTTIMNYQSAIKFLIKQHGLVIDEFLDNPKRRGQELIDKMILENAVNAAFNTYIYSLRALLRAYDIDYKSIEWKYPRNKARVYRDRLPTLEELKYILDKASLKQKVVVLLLISSGMRQSTMKTIKLRDFAYDDENQILRINAYSSKSRHSYTTFATKEFWDTFLHWLGELKTTHKIGQDDCIFKKYYFCRNGIVNEVSDYHWSHMMSDEINARIFDKCDALKRQDGDVKFSAHTLRKFFKTACVNSGMKELYSEAMMGHKTSIQQIYFTPTEDDMMKEYKKAAPKLTITSVVMESSDRMKELEKRMNAMEEELKYIKSRSSLLKSTVETR